MRHLLLTVMLVAAALLVTFGVGAMLEHTAFKAGPEPGVGTPSGGPMPPQPVPPSERRSRARHVA